jgi:hypothetical protein
MPAIRILLTFICLTLLCSMSVAKEKSEDYIAVKIRGTVTTGVMAPGGETTGIIIIANKLTFELEISDAKLKKHAEELNGKKAVVEGELEIRNGVAVKERKIIVVKELKPAS